MAARRPKGAGTLTQRSDGLWIGRVDAGWTPQGTRRRMTVSSRSKAECQRKLRDLIRKVNAGEVAATASTRITVKAWSDTWLTMHAAKVRPTTYTTDAGAIRKWIIPTIGHRRLADLTPADVRALRAAIMDGGRSSTTALHATKLLNKMLKDAAVEGHSIPERVRLAPKPAKAANDRGAMPLDQLIAVLAVIAQRPNVARWLLAIIGAVRQGEALGLTRDRVHLGDDPHVVISRQLQRLKPGHATPDGWDAQHLVGRAYLTPTKTASGSRVIPLVPLVADAFAAAIAAWEPNKWGLLFVGEDGLPRKSAHDRAEWREIQAEAGVKHPSGRPWLVHECRHTALTLLLAAGTDRRVIEAIAGQAKLVESYIHVDQSLARSALVGLTAQIMPGDGGTLS